MTGFVDTLRYPIEIAPGAVHLPGWLDLEQQRLIVASYRKWIEGPVPLRAAALPNGHRMSVETVCLGWHWRPYRYTRDADDVNGAPVLDFPAWLAELGRRAPLDASYDPAIAAAYRPDPALANFYSEGARLGMHQDKDERVNEPVVSLSVGDTCRFRFGNPRDRNKPYTDIDLASGDAFVFGGPYRAKCW
jgi:DNA oxidative demethylase